MSENAHSSSEGTASSRRDEREGAVVPASREELRRVLEAVEEQATLLEKLAEELTRTSPKEVLTIDEAARVLRVGRAATLRYLDRHNLVVEVEGRRRVLRAALLDSLRPVAGSASRRGASWRSSSNEAERLFVLATD